MPVATVITGTVRTQNRRRSKSGCSSAGVPICNRGRPVPLGMWAATMRKCSTLAPLRSPDVGSGSSSGRSQRTRIASLVSWMEAIRSPFSQALPPP